MNNVSLIGRLTKDPELRYTANNTAVASFSIAVNRDYKVDGQPEADFIPIVTWNKTAEFAQKYFQKGLQVGVVGRIQTRTWEDDQKVKHYVTEIVAEKLYFAEGKRDVGQQQQQQQPAPADTQPQSGYQTPSNPPPAQGAQQPTATGAKKPWERS